MLKEDLTGKRFGRLVALERAKKENNRNIHWLCECDCGNYLRAQANHLKYGRTKSCGCLNSELASKRKMYEFGSSVKSNLIRGYKMGAKIRELEWKISDKLFFETATKDCYYCGQPPTNTYNKFSNGGFMCTGVDRINSSKGYIRGNIVPCCTICNRAKSDIECSKYTEWIDNLVNFKIAMKKLEENGAISREGNPGT